MRINELPFGKADLGKQHQVWYGLSVKKRFQEKCRGKLHGVERFGKEVNINLAAWLEKSAFFNKAQLLTLLRVCLGPSVYNRGRWPSGK